MFTQLGVEFIQWIKHQKNVIVGYSQTTKKMMMFYVGSIVNVLLCKWFPLNVKTFKVMDEF
jgi:hypothetical protein